MKSAKFSKSFIRSEEGISSVEAAMILPVLLMFLLGIYEIGMGISSNQKTIRASQIAADLLSRERIVTNNDVYEAFEASRQAILPLDDSNLGIDVVSVEYGVDGAGNEIIDPLWRETQNMSEDAALVDDMSGLGDPGEGALGVVVTYRYDPLFSSGIFETIEMREVAFVRSRKSSIITREN